MNLTDVERLFTSTTGDFAASLLSFVYPPMRVTRHEVSSYNRPSQRSIRPILVRGLTWHPHCRTLCFFSSSHRSHPSRVVKMAAASTSNGPEPSNTSHRGELDRIAIEAVKARPNHLGVYLTPSTTSILWAFDREGSGDRELLLALLAAKTAEDTARPLPAVTKLC